MYTVLKGELLCIYWNVSDMEIKQRNLFALCCGPIAVCCRRSQCLQCKLMRLKTVKDRSTMGLHRRDFVSNTRIRLTRVCFNLFYILKSEHLSEVGTKCFFINTTKKKTKTKKTTLLLEKLHADLVCAWSLWGRRIASLVVVKTLVASHPCMNTDAT